MPVSYQGLLSGLLALTEQTYAPHPVWSGSKSKPVQFTPLPKKVAMRLWPVGSRRGARARQCGDRSKAKGRGETHRYEAAADECSHEGSLPDNGMRRYIAHIFGLRSRLLLRGRSRRSPCCVM